MIEINLEKELHGANGAMELNVSLTIEEGEFLAIAGKSGSGKTTLLRIIAGLEEAKGIIRVGEEFWLNGKKAVAPQKRGVGFVFQDFALFDNMSVEQNLLFANSDKALAKYLLEITELSSLAKRLPSSLSGGQKQRVSLCRAMMKRPKLLLMDEPLSALDPSMRTKLQNEILQLHKEFNTTTIMISHDPSEIYKLANRVVYIEDGKLLKSGSPKDILLKSTGSQKLSFEGELIDIIKADILSIAVVAIGQQLVELALSKSELHGLQIGDRVTVSTKAFAPTLS
ncbi:MAG TPA: ATP-binding cassette domain-containing protein [Nitratifractor sp.]|jgi:molybdate transport system ATP-binding protein|nr:ATP-binding cassette domain-containing protein [Nitratifractor sp.]HHH20726.1 ATP-binding cassette domain-containing protein [Nitratifractor sp.]